MRIPSGKTDQNIYFVAVDATDLKSRETGLSSFTVYRSRNGAAEVQYTTPTVSEIDTTNMPGVYALLVDEDTTIGASSDSEEYCVHITHAGMAPVTRTIELYRRDTTSGQTLDVSAGGEAGLDWANIGSPTTAQNLSATNIDVDQVVASVSGAVSSVTGFTASDVGAIKAKTDNLPSDPADQSLIIAATDALATLIGDVPTNAELATALGTADDAVLTAIDDLPTNAELATALGTADDAVLAQIALVKAKTDNLPTAPADQSLVIAATDAILTAVNTKASQASVDDLPTNAELATALGTADDAVLAQVALVKATTDKLDDTLEDDAGTFRFTTNALEQAPTGGSAPTAAEIADAVWDEAQADHVAAGSFGEIATEVAAIKIKTDNLPSDPADQSLIVAATDALATLIDNLPTNAELATALGTADDAVLTQIALVKAKADLIPGTQDGKTFAELMVLIGAVLLGKASGLDTNTAVFRAVDDSKDRVTATVDEFGNRSAVTLDAA